MLVCSYDRQRRPQMPALVAWGRSMLTMTPPGSRKGWGEGSCKAYKDGWTTKKASLGTFLGHRCVVFSVWETTPGLKSPV